MSKAETRVKQGKWFSGNVEGYWGRGEKEFGKGMSYWKVCI